MGFAQGRHLTRPRHAAILAVVFLASYAYFYEGGGWNQNTRFDLVRAIVERHTVRIDAYHENTGDKARMGEHYYTDKAPGASLTAVPAVALVRGVMRAVGGDIETPRAVIGLSYVATLMAAALPAAGAALCVFLICLRLGATDTAAALAAIVCGLGTPLWPYATLLYGHALAGGCLMGAFLAAFLLAEASTAGRQTTLGVLTGLAAGWAVVTEFPASVPAAIIIGFALWQCGRADRARLFRIALAMGAGLAASAIVLLGYSWLAFGAPFHLGYVSEEGSYDAMRTGIFGVNWPTWLNTRAILFGEYRGLLPLAPVLVVVPAGFWMLLRDRRTRTAGVTAAAVATFYIVMTAGYAYWSGGWSYGSRHLGPALPFLCLGVAPVWRRGGATLRGLILVLAFFGVAQSLIAVSTTPQPPNDVQRPMRELLWPAFRDGEFPIGWQSVLELRPSGSPSAAVPRASWNLGQLLGLTGHASLLPLLAIWMLGAVAWVLVGPPSARRQKRDRSEASHGRSGLSG